MMRFGVIVLALAFFGCMSSGGGGGGGGGFDDAGPDRPAAMCVSGETRSCACPGATMGVQTCERDGSGFGPCGMCPAVIRCGDGTCTPGSETCTSCPADCGACMMAPRCGDGACTTGSETCRNCSDDCGACPAECGNNMCETGETCSSCPGDCGACETACMGCAQDLDCPTGFACLLRRCDGARGCYPRSDSNASCANIGGVRCPATGAYNTCATNAECGTFAECSRYGDGRLTCGRRCARDADCPAAPIGFTGATPRCDTSLVRPVCFLNCTGPGMCPYGLSCFRYNDGRYGYCS